MYISLISSCSIDLKKSLLFLPIVFFKKLRYVSKISRFLRFFFAGAWASIRQNSACLIKRKVKTIQRNSKEIEIMILLSYLVIFLANFWVYHFCHFFDVFNDSGSFPMHSNGCFLMPWRSRNHPRLILDRFGKSHFFMKIFKILTHMSEPSFQKNHMYIQTLDNLRVPRSKTTQKLLIYWIIIKF